MDVEQDWTCPCGHEVAADGECVVWDSRGDEHRVPINSSRCTCHGRDVIHDQWRR